MSQEKLTNTMVAVKGGVLGKIARGARGWRLTRTHRRESKGSPDRIRAASLQKEPTKNRLFYTEP